MRNLFGWACIVLTFALWWSIARAFRRRRVLKNWVVAVVIIASTLFIVSAFAAWRKWDAALYSTLVFLSLVWTFVATCMHDLTIRNIEHIKNGRRPNASTSVLPLIPIPIACLLVAMALNHFAQYLGTAIVGGFLVFGTCYSCWRYNILRLNLKELLANQRDTA